MPDRRRVLLRDSTLREGLDTPGVTLVAGARVRIAGALAAAGVAEAEVVAPSRVRQDLPVAAAIRRAGIPLALGGLVYAAAPDARDEIDAAAPHLDTLDLLVPLAARRPPADPAAKRRLLEALLAHATVRHARVGVGFPHATQSDESLLLELVETAAAGGARRVIVYDTNGGADPARVEALCRRVAAAADLAVHFHGHDDRGLATANALAAVRGGAGGLDVTVNGLGDRAGNAALEQVAMNLRLAGLDVDVDLAQLPALSAVVAEATGLAPHPLAPVVGTWVFVHKSPSHLATPDLFEAFDPAVLGRERRLDE